MTRRWLAVLALAAGTALFGAAMAGRHAVNPWHANAAAALVVIALSAAAMGSRMRALFAPRLRSAIVAAGVGVVMVAATHLGFRLASDLFPELQGTVAGLYRDIDDPTPGEAWTLILVSLIVGAEEVLWRGVAVEICREQLSRTWAAVVAVTLYALPQVIGGSLVLVAAAVVVGTVFTVQRLAYGRLTEPLITHLIWSVSVMILVPVT